MTFSKERDQKQRKERTKEGRKVKKRKGKKRGKWRKGSMGMVEWKKGTFCLLNQLNLVKCLQHLQAGMTKRKTPVHIFKYTFFPLSYTFEIHLRHIV